MPSYTYQCPQCGYFVYRQGIKEAPLAQCPTCGQPVHRVIGQVNVLLKSDGFYATDHKANNSSTGEE